MSTTVSTMDTNVIKVTHKCAIHATTTHQVTLVRSDEARRSGEAPFSYEKLQERLRNIFGIAHSARFILTYKDNSDEGITIATKDDLNDAMRVHSARHSVWPLCMNIRGHYSINLKCPIKSSTLALYYVKLQLGRISRRMDLLPGQSDFSFEQFQSDIRYVFKLPLSTHFVFTYPYACRGGYRFIDDKITISSTEELKTFLAEEGREGRRDGLEVSSLTILVIGHVTIEYNCTFRLLTLSPDVLEFSYEQLESCIRDLFNLREVSGDQLQLIYKDVAWKDITITRTEEVKDVLVMLSLNQCPLLVVRMLEEADTDAHIDAAILEKNSESDGVMVVHEDNFRILTPVELELSYEKLESRILDLFELPLSAQFELSYEETGNEILNRSTISKSDEELKDVLLRLSKDPLHLRLYVEIMVDQEDSGVTESNSPAKNTSPFVVMVTHNGDERLVTFPAGELALADESESLFEKFKSSIRDRFNLPGFVEFVLSYINEDGDNITMSKDEDLEHAIALKTHDHLQVNLRIGWVRNEMKMRDSSTNTETQQE